MSAERWSAPDYCFVAALVLLLLVTRLPFMAEYLYEWDSIQFALGLERYDVPLHQPHPPGYPLYMLAAGAVNAILGDAEASLSLLSLFFSCLAIPAIYALGKDMAGRGAAVMAAIALFCAPVFWLYGEVSTIYAAEGLWATLIALACYRASKGKRGWLLISAALLGIAGGFRGNIVLFLFPLWLYCALKGCREAWRILAALLVLSVAILSWLLPLFVLFGGEYLEASRLLYGYSNITSIFVDPAGRWLTNAAKALLYTVYGFGPLCSILLLWFLAAACSSRRRIRGDRAQYSNRLLDWAFFLWWVLPPFAYYLLLHIKKPGYTLTYIPAFALLLGCLFYQRASRRGSAALWAVLAGALACNLLLLFPPRGRGSGISLATGGRRFSLRRLDDKGGALRAIRLLSERVDGRTAVISENNGFTRFASYYLPGCYVYHSDFVRPYPLLVYHDRRVVARSGSGTIDLMPGIREIAVIGPAESVAFADPGLTTKEISTDPPVTIFRVSPQFRAAVYEQEDRLGEMKVVRIRRKGRS